MSSCCATPTTNPVPALNLRHTSHPDPAGDHRALSFTIPPFPLATHRTYHAGEHAISKQEEGQPRPSAIPPSNTIHLGCSSVDPKPEAHRPGIRQDATSEPAPSAVCRSGVEILTRARGGHPSPDEAGDSEVTNPHCRQHDPVAHLGAGEGSSRLRAAW